jgi:pyridoxal phosphate enzyme (YggS family)
MTETATQIVRNWTRIMDLCAAAYARARRQREQPVARIVAVTKYARPDWVRELIGLGHRSLGESRPQQLVERAALFPGVEWHLIGQLQRNKVRSVLPCAALIHSVDSLRLLQRIGDIAGELGLVPRVLLQVNVSGETSKQGFAPEDLRTGWSGIRQVRHVQIDGLMTMAPLVDDPEQARPAFRALRELRDQLRNSALDSTLLPELSMGMSNDFEVAIEEGATLVRIGSALFEGLE